MMMYPKNSMIN